jgi:hypothetical protein
MPLITPRLSRAFIEGVKLPSPKRRRRDLTDTPPVAVKATEAQSLVVGSALIVAAEKVPVQTREDLVNCTLFAQLAATASVGNPRRIREWYDAYFKTLTALGWAQSDTQFEEYKFDTVRGEAHKAIIKVLTALLGPQAAALAMVKTTLEALQTMDENSPWIALFDHQSKTGKSARFQVATAQLDASGLLQIALVGFELEAKSTLNQVLFFKFSKSSTRLNFAAGKATIYEAALADQRDAIARRLNDYRTAYIGQVRLPLPPSGGKRQSVRRAAVRTGGSRLKPRTVTRLLLE